jgi:hypothetical protein
VQDGNKFHALRNANKLLVGKPEGKRPIERHRRRLKENIRMDLRERGWEIVYWTHLAQAGTSGSLFWIW